MLRSLSYDRNLVQFYGACLEREHAMLVLEYMEGGDLYQAIQENSYPLDTGLLSWYQKGSTIALDIAKGLVFLHQHEVCSSLLVAVCTCAHCQRYVKNVIQGYPLAISCWQLAYPGALRNPAMQMKLSSLLRSL